MATAEVTDKALADARWDLEPLVDGGGPDGRWRLLDEAKRAGRRVRRRATAGRSPSSTQPGSPRRCASWRRSTTSRAAPARTRSLAFSVDTARPRARRADAAGPRARAAIETALLFFDLEWNEVADERAEELLGRRRARLLPPPPADAAPLPPAPAHRARGADPRPRRRRHRARRRSRGLFTEQISGAHGRALRRRRAGAADGGAEPPAGARPRAARRGGRRRSPRRSRPGCAPAPSSSTRCSQDKATKDRLRSYEHWLASRNLANEASDESVAALIEAVVVALRARAPLVPAEGAAARARAARRLRPDGAGAPRPSADRPTPRRASWCSTATASFSPELGDGRGRVLHRRLHRRAAGARASAAARSAPTRSRRRTRT